MKRMVAFLLMAGCVCAAGVGKVQTVEKMPQHEVAVQSVPVDAAAKPSNVILMIGDGMSSEHVWAAWVCNGGKLNLEQMPVTGFSRTFSANRLVTDSAAGGTALACGHKTNNGMLGQTADGRALSSLASRLYAAPYHKAVGLVVTKAITDATPAAFYAHTASRHNTAEIAKQLCAAPFSVIVGGGSGAFSSAQMQALRKNDQAYVELAAKEHCPYAPERGDFLARQTERALAELEKSPRGFFLMIEGSEIDTASHAADARLAVAETLDFDHALGVVLRWMQSHPDTLLVVTADHQTGGIAIHGGSVQERKVKVSFATTEHTGVAVPVYAAGCGAQKFTGVMDNTQIPQKIFQIVAE